MKTVWTWAVIQNRNRLGQSTQILLLLLEMVSFSVSAFFQLLSLDLQLQIVGWENGLTRDCQGIFQRRESGKESMSIKQWDCLYKNPCALLYAVSGWKLFSIRKPIHSEPSIFLSFFYNVTVKKERKKPRILAYFQTYSGELLTETNLNGNPSQTTNGNSETDCFELFMKQSTLTFQHCVWE